MSDRREFLRNSAFGVAASLLPPTMLAPLAAAATVQGDQGMDESALQFWSEQVRSARVERHSFLKRSAKIDADDRTAEFIRVGPDGRFLTPEEIDERDLLPTGDVSVRINVHGFHPSTEDADRFSKIQTGSLRIDLQQQRALHPLLDLMAWTSVGALCPSNTGKLPAMGDLRFDPGQSWGKLQTVPLPGGAGAWTFNFFLQKRESFFSKFIHFALGESTRFAPALGLPAIGAVALRAFDNVFGFLQAQAHSEWLLKTNDVKVFATQDAAGSVDRTAAVPLVSGDYLVIPRAHVAQFEDRDWSDYEFRRGWIVPRNTPPKQLFEAAKEARPKLTYVSVNVDVKKV